MHVRILDTATLGYNHKIRKYSKEFAFKNIKLENKRKEKQATTTKNLTSINQNKKNINLNKNGSRRE